MEGELFFEEEEDVQYSLIKVVVRVIAHLIFKFSFNHEIRSLGHCIKSPMQNGSMGRRRHDNSIKTEQKSNQ